MLKALTRFADCYKNSGSVCFIIILEVLLDDDGYHTPWPLVRKRTIPTERPPLVGEVSANFCG
jgi:hypothetical protein